MSKGSTDRDKTPALRTATLLPSQEAKLQPVSIEAVEGPGKGPKLEVKVGTITVGTDKSCDLVVEDPTVSRRHLTVELRAGGLLVRDLNSRNGTRYLKAKVESAQVPLGGSVQIGQTTLAFRPLKTREPASERSELLGLIGVSDSMRRVFAVLEKLGPQPSTVLIRGETGTGKTGIAKALHGLSGRADRPFVTFDCASVQPNLVESALFGHVRGAFTGATADAKGAVEEAQGGTLFLDEVGELPPALQPKLLRLLEAREYQPVGASKVKSADIRVLAATHRNLMQEASAGRFRLDLFYRLAVAEVEVPPLRSRLEDIPILAAHFARQLTGMALELEGPTVAAFQCAHWPGNVRELRNAVERTVALGNLDTTPEDEPAQSPSFIEARDKALLRFERDYLVALLKEHKGNASAAARSAKLARSHFYRLLTRHGLVTAK